MLVGDGVFESVCCLAVGEAEEYGRSVISCIVKEVGVGISEIISSVVGPPSLLLALVGDTSLFATGLVGRSKQSGLVDGHGVGSNVSNGEGGFDFEDSGVPVVGYLVGVGVGRSVGIGVGRSVGDVVDGARVGTNVSSGVGGVEVLVGDLIGVNEVDGLCGGIDGSHDTSGGS